MNVGAHVADVRRRWGGPKTAASGLVIADAVPLVGVVAFGWDLHSLLVVYWLESTVIGFETVAKARRSEGKEDPVELSSFSLNGRPYRRLYLRETVRFGRRGSGRYPAGCHRGISKEL